MVRVFILSLFVFYREGVAAGPVIQAALVIKKTDLVWLQFTYRHRIKLCSICSRYGLLGVLRSYLLTFFAHAKFTS